MAKIKTMWAVADPGRDSILADVLWEQDVARLGVAFAGGLDAESLALYDNRAEAEADAKQRLARRDADKAVQS